jgi:hypothetical protein
MQRTDESLSTRDLAASSGRTEEPVDRAEDERIDEPRRTDAVAGEGVATEIPAGGETPERADDTRATADDTRATADDTPERLFPEQEQDDFQRRWEQIQTGFVDDPRHTVEEADELVASVMQRLADGFAQERERLEGQWDRGEDVSTEDLRVALQRYRSFFRRLLSA